MIQVNSPGLPPWPKLWLDRKNSRAVVTVRHPTWRSYECAYLATECIVWVICGVIACVVWQLFAAPEAGLRVFFVLVAMIICFPMVALATRAALREPIARLVFPTKTTFWVTEDSVVFKSRLYVAPVVIWRQWKGRPIGIKFVVQPDAEANQYITDHQPKRKWPRTPISEASIIGIVVSTPAGYDGKMPASNGGLLRFIPVSEVSSRFAQKFSTVLSAALMLVPLDEHRPRASESIGIDIDVAT